MIDLFRKTRFILLLTFGSIFRHVHFFFPPEEFSSSRGLTAEKHLLSYQAENGGKRRETEVGLLSFWIFLFFCNFQRFRQHVYVICRDVDKSRTAALQWKSTTRLLSDFKPLPQEKQPHKRHNNAELLAKKRSRDADHRSRSIQCRTLSDIEIDPQQEYEQRPWNCRQIWPREAHWLFLHEPCFQTRSGCPASYFFLLFGISPTFSYFSTKFLLFPTFWLLKVKFLPIFCDFL